MSTCLVLGGNGFLGSHITKLLLSEGYNVKIFARHFKEELLNQKCNCEFIKGDLLNEDDLKKSLVDVDFLFHYISLTIPPTSVENPFLDNKNVTASLKLLELARKNDVEKIIFPSSGGTVYGESESLPISESHPTQPLSPYGISKLTIEKYLHYYYKNYNIDYNIFRYSNPYGPLQNPLGNMGVISVFLGKIKQNQNPVIFGKGNAIRDYIYVEDAVKVNLIAIQTKTKNKIFNVGSGEGKSINEVLEIIMKVTSQKVTPKYIETRKGDVSKVVLDINKIKNEMKWTPETSFSEGIKKTWHWINNK